MIGADGGTVVMFNTTANVKPTMSGARLISKLSRPLAYSMSPLLRSKVTVTAS